MSAPKKSKPSYFYAIVGVSLVLFLLGTLGWLLINGRSLTKAFKEDIEMQVVFHDATRPEKVSDMKAMLDGQSFVKNTVIVTKEQAAKEFQQEWGDDFGQLLEYNPLYTSIKMNMHSEYVNKDSLKKIEQFLKQSNVVREVVYPNTVIEKLNSNFRRLSIILGVIAVIFFLIAIVLIDNTVRLAMFSNRFLIKTMQMVGATHKFISRPFEQRAVINGLISGVIAVVGLWLVISFATSNLPELNALHDPLMIGLLLLGMIVVGILISVISTHRSVLKYLKIHVDDLY
ncbi:MAG TPA: permease-like cell division protein FtsX [Flavipsychrobacter sp.]|nr:permease-like cell division protein FtsX [Flavipsychrobacter sp.]